MERFELERAAPSDAISSTLTSVSCPTRSFCEAVGFYLNGSSTHQTLAETWNGFRWSLTASPDPSGETGSELSGVAMGRRGQPGT